MMTAGGGAAPLPPARAVLRTARAPSPTRGEGRNEKYAERAVVLCTDARVAPIQRSARVSMRGVHYLQSYFRVRPALLGFTRSRSLPARFTSTIDCSKRTALESPAGASASA